MKFQVTFQSFHLGDFVSLHCKTITNFDRITKPDKTSEPQIWGRLTFRLVPILSFEYRGARSINSEPGNNLLKTISNRVESIIPEPHADC